MIAAPRRALERLADDLAPDPLNAWDEDDHDDRLQRLSLGETTTDRLIYTASLWAGVFALILLHLGGMAVAVWLHTGTTALALVGIMWVSLILQMALMPRVLERMYLATLQGRHHHLARADLLDHPTYGLEPPSAETRTVRVGEANQGTSHQQRQTLDQTLKQSFVGEDGPDG